MDLPGVFRGAQEAKAVAFGAIWHTAVIPTASYSCCDQESKVTLKKCARPFGEFRLPEALTSDSYDTWQPYTLAPEKTLPLRRPAPCPMRTS